MILSPHQRLVQDDVASALREIGYTRGNILEEYAYADYLSSQTVIRTVPLVSFAQFPPSYRNACIAIDFRDDKSPSQEILQQHRGLGAPIFLEIRNGEILCWITKSDGESVLSHTVAPERIKEVITDHSDDWNPKAVLRAKAIKPVGTYQLDFSDLGLLPVIESAVNDKLDRLLREVIHECVQQSAFSKSTQSYQELFRLIFRLLAAKVLQDRNHQVWNFSSDVDEVVASVGRFYSNDAVSTGAVLESESIRRIAWSRIQEAFHFQNVSVESLAYIYENTLVSSETRKVFGTHGTPHGIADFVVDSLPFHEIPSARILEPFSGHGVFLISAMRRLKEVMPHDFDPIARHRYLTEHLVGVEIDAFALEVSRLCLMLADYPHPNGWQLIHGDVFHDRVLERHLRQTDIVLCNPPFEAFTAKERAGYNAASAQKPAELMRRILLTTPPQMLGVVLPRAVIDGRAYAEIRSLLARTYGHIETLALPDKVFSHSDAETALVMAHGTATGRTVVVQWSAISEANRSAFLSGLYRVPWASTVNNIPKPQDDFSIWYPSLQNIWDRLSGNVRLGEIADVHRGLQFKLSLEHERDQLISSNSRAHFRLGLDKIRNHLGLFEVFDPLFINTDPEVQFNYAYRRPWDRPKVLINAATVSRGRWRILAYPDYSSLVCTQRFHAIWPTPAWRIESLAAILVGPVANAFLTEHSNKRDIQRRVVMKIPMPSLEHLNQDRICELVRFYQQNPERRRETLLEIDADVLRAYRLHPRLERELLDYFANENRPGADWFRGYYPTAFRASLPLHELVFSSYDEFRAREILRRLSIIDDPLASAFFRELEEEMSSD